MHRSASTVAHQVQDATSANVAEYSCVQGCTLWPPGGEGGPAD